MSQITDIVARARLGQISRHEMQSLLATYPFRTPTDPHASDANEPWDVQESNSLTTVYPQDGTWQELESLVNHGKLAQADYDVVSQMVDAQRKAGKQPVSAAEVELSSGTAAWDARRDAKGRDAAVTNAVLEAAKQGGGSVQAETGKAPNPPGHMVAGITPVTVLDPDHMSRPQLISAIHDFRTTNADKIAGQYIGVWTNPDTHEIELEGSEKQTGGRSAALQSGFDRDQIAVWDLALAAEREDGDGTINVMSDGKRPSESSGTRVT